MTCAHFGQDQIFTQVDASFSPFGHPLIHYTVLANEIQDMSALKCVLFFCDLRVLARGLLRLDVG